MRHLPEEDNIVLVTSDRLLPLPGVPALFTSAFQRLDHWAQTRCSFDIYRMSKKKKNLPYPALSSQLGTMGLVEVASQKGIAGHRRVKVEVRKRYVPLYIDGKDW